MRRYHSSTDWRRAHSIAELADMARRRLPHFAWEYVQGGAEDELTLQRNRQAFAELGFAPRTLVPCSAPTTARALLGRPVPLPMVIAPTGYNAMLYRDADLHLARAATERGLPYGLSTVSTSDGRSGQRSARGRPVVSVVLPARPANSDRPAATGAGGGLHHADTDQ